MTASILQTLQYYLIFIAMWGEAILLGILFNRFAIEHIHNIWINLALIVAVAGAILYLSAFPFNAILDVLNPPGAVDFSRTGSVAVDIALAPFYAAAWIGEHMKNLYEVIIGTFLTPIIWLLTIATIRIRIWRKGELS